MHDGGRTNDQTVRGSAQGARLGNMRRKGGNRQRVTVENAFVVDCEGNRSFNSCAIVQISVRPVGFLQC